MYVCVCRGAYVMRSPRESLRSRGDEEVCLTPPTRLLIRAPDTQTARGPTGSSVQTEHTRARADTCLPVLPP